MAVQPIGESWYSWPTAAVMGAQRWLRRPGQFAIANGLTSPDSVARVEVS
jgi:hypothetical protein